ncbi:hypothetical protein AVEN_106423-1 [Araneus ventricosus]|uniref:Uncharacterized protein n=1 Tax=Araneus ventricosus TaxID=182803 RepID=A0A4Y2AUQ8_ARAVE|nr:hypothetical protein AVEN_106423-1 [Araneus ventricosus]
MPNFNHKAVAIHLEGFLADRFHLQPINFADPSRECVARPPITRGNYPPKCNPLVRAPAINLSASSFSRIRRDWRVGRACTETDLDFCSYGIARVLLKYFFCADYLLLRVWFYVPTIHGFASTKVFQILILFPHPSLFSRRFSTGDYKATLSVPIFFRGGRNPYSPHPGPGSVPYLSVSSDVPSRGSRPLSSESITPERCWPHLQRKERFSFIPCTGVFAVLPIQYIPDYPG